MSLSPALRHRFDRLTMRVSELEGALADPAVMSQVKRLTELTREHAQAQALLRTYQAYLQVEADQAQARSWLEDAATDPALAEMAREELAGSEQRLGDLQAELHTALIPVDPEDARPAFLEIRAGTGGDESTLFAADLARMYLRYCERQGWRTELMSESSSDLGGYKELVLRVDGEGAYGRLRLESGGHRVQRVPVTESQGRIHTSACTVAVMPEPEASDEVTLNPADLRIDTFRASGAGGQHVNKTDSAIRITHLPSGLVAECQDDRSQHRNKAKAMAVLTARLRDRERQARESQQAATRKSLVGTGDRSDRIRTYNFPQGRLTDHRINLTIYQLAAVMEGDLDGVLHALAQARAAQALQAIETGEA